MTQNPATTLQSSLLAGVLDSSQDGVMAFSAVRDHRGRIIDFQFEVVNRRAEEITGRKANDLIGQRLLDQFPGNRTDGLFDAYVRVVQTNKPFTTQLRYAHDGLDHWLAIRAAACGCGFAVSFSDITEQKTSEDQIRKLSHVASRTSNAVIITDAQGRIEWINRGFTTITGYTQEEVEGKTPGSMLQGPLTDPKTIARISKNLRTGKGFHETLVNYHKSGRPYWIEIEVQPLRNAAGEITNFMAIEADVTERIEQQQQLEAQRQRLEFALQTSHTGLWDWHVQSGQTYYSDTWYTMLGYEPGSLPASIDSWVELTEPSDLRRAKSALDAYFRGETERYSCEMRMRHKAGHWQWILDVGQAVERDEQGQVTRMVGVHLDIDEQKRIQNELAQARDQAQQASAAKSAFVANMSHEIRTPMNAILGYADLLLDHEQSAADKRNHAQTIRRNGRHLMTILNDILDLSKIEAGKMNLEYVTCSPVRLAHEVVELMLPQALEKDLALRIETPGPLPRHIKTDPTRVKQVLMNLVGNAIKFSDSGQITMRLSAESVDDDAIELRYEISDNGIGIDASQVHRLFEPFSQADESTTRRFGGTGLGLAISRKLCTLLGGGLSCTSVPGEGSTFTARFRVLAVEQQAAMECVSGSADRLPTPSLKGARILVVEDGPDNKMLFQHFLIKAGAIVQLADNGAVALKAFNKAQQQGQPFDAVLMDMQMPVLDGYRATRELRDQGQTLPIIALTAHASHSDRDKCLAAGCTDYLSKPVDRGRLIQTLLDHLNPAIQEGAGI